jgi:hypothetical protein
VGRAGVGIESILVYAYILIYRFRSHGFFGERFENQGFWMMAISSGVRP